MSSVPHTAATVRTSSPRFHAIAWRWHFYAGLFVTPFLLMLAITGLVMVYFTGFQSRLGSVVHVAPEGQAAPLAAQAEAALGAFDGATLKEYVAPAAPGRAAWFLLAHADRTQAVAVNPYTLQRLRTVDSDDTVFAWANKIHGTLLLGDVGDRLIEVAAGLGIVMVVTGLYLFWPRNGALWSTALVPEWKAKGRRWWKSLHASLGFWIAIVLLAFLVTGMSWTGIWGGKLVQAWSSFPAAKWDAVPTSDKTHASLNHGSGHEVPWGLEQTPMPRSVAQDGGAAAVSLDSVAAQARQLGFTGQFHIHLPQDATGVYTVSRDTMSGDLGNPFQDRTVHIDRYSGKVLADVGYADYSPMARFMAVGIALHQGDLGLWSAWLNVLFCLAVVLMCASGMVMWWVRRPRGSGRLAAPPMPAEPNLWKGGAIVMLLTGLAFPLAGGVLLAVVLLDWMVVSRLPRLKAVLS